MNNTPHNPPVVIPLAHAARRFHVPTRWLRAEAEAGRVPALSAGNTYLFNTVALEASLAERAAQPPAQNGGGQ